MSIEACPHCHEQFHKTEDGCGTERCIARRAFVRQAAIRLSTAEWITNADLAWENAVALWTNKPEGC